MYQSDPQVQFRGPEITDTGKKMLIIYIGLYVTQLISEHWLGLPVSRQLMLFGVKTGNFHFWQVLTHPFLHHPAQPLGFLLNCLMFYFFHAAVERRLGTRSFLTLYFVAAYGGALIGLLFSAFSSFNGPFYGMLPSVLTLIVVFGFMNPEATILLFFILPIKAKMISYVTILITFLTFLAMANPQGSVQLGAIGCGYAYFVGPKYFFDPNWWYGQYLLRKLQRRKGRFTVYRNNDDDDDANPTIH